MNRPAANGSTPDSYPRVGGFPYPPIIDFVAYPLLLVLNSYLVLTAPAPIGQLAFVSSFWLLLKIIRLLRRLSA